MFLATGSTDDVIRIYYMGSGNPEKKAELNSHTVGASFLITAASCLLFSGVTEYDASFDTFVVFRTKLTASSSVIQENGTFVF